MPFKMGLYSPTTIPLNSKKSPRQNCSLQAHGLLSTLLQARFLFRTSLFICTQGLVSIFDFLLPLSVLRIVYTSVIQLIR